MIRTASETSVSIDRTSGGRLTIALLLRLGSSNSSAITSFKIIVSDPSRARVRSSNHSMMTATTCSRKVSYARRTVTPSSICANFCATSSTRGTSVLISMTSRPRSSTRFAISVASSRDVEVRKRRSSITSVKECFSSFQSTTQ